jgi:pimeloyl-ACP methyl ester carboxylesterase
MALPPRVDAWRGLGRREEFRGRGIHVFTRAGDGPTLVLLHGFPSSSYDWRGLVEALPGQAVLAFDFVGFGLSDKPRDHRYSLLWQTDLTEELVQRHVPGPVFVVAHDMGTSVATELMARDLAGEDGTGAAGMLLFNGSILQHLATPTAGQRLLRSPLGPLAARLSSRRFFLNQFGSIFSREHPLSDEEGADQWALLCHGHGRRLGHKLIGYMSERGLYAERWHGAIRDWQGRLSLAWGLDDPVATRAVLDGLRQLRPGVEVDELPGVGHYPQIEVPERFAEIVRSRVREAA